MGGRVDIVETLTARSMRPPVTTLWFSEPRAGRDAILFLTCSVLGAWMAWRFHVQTDQVLSGRSAWLGAGHGMAGFLFGAGSAGFCLWLAAQRLARLATRAPAFAMTQSGIRISALVSLPIGNHIRLAYDEIGRVQIERREPNRRFPFNLGRNPPVLDLVVYPRSAKPIRMWSGDLRGGHRQARRFAEALRRALALGGEGRL